MAGAGVGRTHLVLREEDVVKLVCEFLENRAMTISQISLERESGVINGDLSDDIVFLRKIFSKINKSQQQLGNHNEKNRMDGTLYWIGYFFIRTYLLQYF